MQVGIGVFVQAMRSHALRRAPKAGAIGADRDLLMADGGEDDAIAERLADQGSAFRYFARVPCQPGRKTVHQRDRGKESRVAASAPPAQNRPLR